MHVALGYLLPRPTPEAWYNKRVYFDINDHWGNEEAWVQLLWLGINHW